ADRIDRLPVVLPLRIRQHESVSVDAWIVFVSRGNDSFASGTEWSFAVGTGAVSDAVERPDEPELGADPGTTGQGKRSGPALFVSWQYADHAGGAGDGRRGDRFDPPRIQQERAPRQAHRRRR